MAVHINGEEKLEINPETIDEASLINLHRLLKQCIEIHRRIVRNQTRFHPKNYSIFQDAVNYNITDSQLQRRITLIVHDLRAYRHVLIENLIVAFEPDCYLESLRIVEKGMQIVESSTDEVCVIVGNNSNAQE
ncbi:hypothetical protein CAEBREN_05551 [Caenorhabditis brenneri]|uniref:Uncharacterized protein n=1 Tax=Caenorhabditis brenneri TaxID=135651 RepID=G0M8F7_CAEBE|nr:hypothetical protein CAEBREN_05551 [Caenorhabditis brenneri]